MGCEKFRPTLQEMWKLTCLSQKVPQESQPSASCGHRARDVAKALLAASLSSTAASSWPCSLKISACHSAHQVSHHRYCEVS